MIGLIVALIGIASRAATTPLSADLVTKSAPDLTGIAAFTSIHDLPYLRTGVQTHQFSSYDRAGDNYDADYFAIYKEPNGECVLFDSFGPGCLYRLHANFWNGDLTGINIRFYFDGEAKPRIDMDVTKFFSPENPLGLFKEPYGHIGFGWRFLYQPFFYKHRLKVALSREPFGERPLWDKLPWLGRYDKHPERRNHWYNFTYHTYTEGDSVRSWAKPFDMSTVATLWDPKKLGEPIGNQAGKKVLIATPSVSPGTTSTLWTLKGQGAITAIRVKIDRSEVNALFDTWLVIRFDDKAPQVSVPLACLFGIYRTSPEKRIASKFVGSIGDELYCYFPMPFWKRAVFSLMNLGSAPVTHLKVELEWSNNVGARYPADSCGYFHTSYHREAPRTEGHDYRYVDERGHGHIVGHFTFRTNTSMEEDERTYFDDSRSPSITGEGFEDDHNQGWGLRDAQQAIWGSTASDGGSGAPWRFFIPELYVFNSSVRHGHQVYGPNSPLGHEGMYQVGSEESVAFLYAREESALRQTDEFDPGNLSSEKLHHYRVFGKRIDRKGAWWYDGEQNNVLFKVPAIADDGVSTDKGTEFRVSIDPRNNGVKLRRRTDKENNRQLAEVFVDGVKVTERPWYNVDFERTFRSIRWFDTDFEIPARYTKGKNSITVRVVPISSKTGLWDEFHYWAFSYI